MALSRLTLRPPHVFLSYRRADSAEATGRIYERLADAFGEACVFMDTTRQRDAEEFWPPILAAVDRSDWVVAVIGRDWLRTEGENRLDDPQDFVRRELERALVTPSKVVPVLVEGAKPVREDDLPEALRPLARLHAIEVRHQSFGTDVARVIRAVDRRLMARVTLACAAVVVVLAAMAWMSVLDATTVAMEDWTMAIGDTLMPATLDPSVMLVTLNEASVAKLGPFGPSWRRHHARLVDALSAAGARTIAFDMDFVHPSEFDQPFADAVRRARDHGTRVVVATTGADDPPVVAPLAEAGVIVGIAAVGKRLGRASTVPLAVLRPRGDGPPQTLAAFTLDAAYPFAAAIVPSQAPRRLVQQLVDARAEVTIHGDRLDGPRTVTGSWRETVWDGQLAEGFRIDDQVVHLMLRMSPLPDLQRAPVRIAYEDVVAGDRPLPAGAFDDRIVLVGKVGDARDTKDTTLGFRRERRAGVELHADAVSTVLRDDALWRLGELWTVVLTLAMGLLGWRVRRLGGRFASPLVLAAVVAGFAALAMLAYLTVSVLIAVPLPLAAFLTTYLATGRPTTAAA